MDYGAQWAVIVAAAALLISLIVARLGRERTRKTRVYNVILSVLLCLALLIIIPYLIVLFAGD